MTQVVGFNSKPIVLIAHGQEWSARSLESIFPAERFEVRRARTGTEALSAARQLQPLIVILDYAIPDPGCTDVCRELLSDATFPLSTPIVITSDTNPGRTQQLAALRAGAWDFCVQPLDGDVFYQKIMTFVEASWIVQQARMESITDEATGLYNEKGFRLRAREYTAHLARGGEAVTVALIRLAERPDNPPGAMVRAPDYYAATFRDSLARACRASDLAGRISDMEFVLLTRATSEYGVQRLLERVREHLDAQRSVDESMNEVTVSASYATSPGDPKIPADVDQLIDRARSAEAVGL